MQPRETLSLCETKQSHGVYEGAISTTAVKKIANVPECTTGRLGPALLSPLRVITF